MAGISHFEDLNIFSLDGRLESFRRSKWPQFTKSKLSSRKSSNKFKISPETMSNAGFFAKPIDGTVDNASCGFCRKNLDGWGEDDVAWDEHVSHCSDCPLVNLHEQVNRELSFTLAGWPHGGSIAPVKMAKAGFFFWPKLQSDDDTAVCVQCGLALDGWEPNDDPRHEHSRRRPACPYLVTGQVHEPSHYRLLLASRKTEDAMREFKQPVVERKRDVKIVEKMTDDIPMTTSKRRKQEVVASSPKFKIPVKTAPPLPVISKELNPLKTTTKKVAETPKIIKPVPQFSESTTCRTRASARKSSIYSRTLPLRLDVSTSQVPSVQSTPLTKRSTQQPRQSTIRSEPPKFDYLKEALEELKSTVSISDDQLDAPLGFFLQSLVDSKMAEFDSEVNTKLALFEAEVCNV